MDNFLSGPCIFQKTGLKDRNFLNFIIRKKKCINKIHKKFLNSNSMSKEKKTSETKGN